MLSKYIVYNNGLAYLSGREIMNIAVAVEMATDNTGNVYISTNSKNLHMLFLTYRS